MRAARIAGIGVHLPARIRSSEETVDRLARENPDLRLPLGLLGRITGIDGVHVHEPGEQTSDLAVHAARAALAESPGPIDLLIFASASQDLIEPATSHIVAAKLGIAPAVMDVKNACNSMVNGIQVADALIRTGQHSRALVVTGEEPSHAVRWRVESHAQFLRSFPGYTMSDGGAAVVLEACDAAVGDSHILGHHFIADSSHWQVGTLGTGGSMDPHAVDGSHFDIDGRALQRAFLAIGPGPVREGLARLGLTVDDLDSIAIHQVASTVTRPIMHRLGVADGHWVDIVREHGNLASASLPVQLETARRRGLVGPGSLVGLIGLAGGISIGITVVRL